MRDLRLALERTGLPCAVHLVFGWTRLQQARISATSDAGASSEEVRLRYGLGLRTCFDSSRYIIEEGSGLRVTDYGSDLNALTADKKTVTSNLEPVIPFTRGAAVVHEVLGAGRTASEYVEALREFLSASNLTYTYKPNLLVYYKNALLPHTFPADFTAENNTALVYVVSLPEAVPKWMKEQLFYKMRASRVPVGAIFNLGRKVVEKYRVEFIKGAYLSR
jgi:GxxExxY protein